MSQFRKVSGLYLGAIAGVVCASGCNVIIGLDKLSPDKSGPVSACTTNQACTEQATLAAAEGPDASIGPDGVVPAVCLQSEGRCVNLLSEDCKTITGDYKDDRAILIGSLFVLQGATATQNVPRQQSAMLAVEEINAAGGIPSSTAGISQPLVMVSCDSSNLERAARHLAYDIKVPAIVGPNTSQDTLDVSNKVTIQAGVVAISPTAVAASIADLRDNDMTWLMIPSDDQRAPLMIRDINDMEANLKQTRGLSSVKLSIIYRDDALGVGTRNSMSALVINGKPLADPVNAGSPSGNAHIVPYPAKDADYASIISKEVAFAPDIVVLAGTAETVTKLLTPLEEAWTAPTRPFYYFIDPSKGPELLAAAGSNEDLRVRIRGTGTLPTQAARDVANAFNLAYMGRYDGAAPTASGTGACYDAAYSIAYALATIKDEPISGASVAKGLRKLSGGSVDVSTGAQNLQKAFQTLASGQAINGLGTNCPLEWDSRGIVAGGTIDMWCIGNSGGTPVFQSSGLTFDIKSQTYTGAYTQCGP